MLTVICVSLLVGFKPKQLEDTDALMPLMLLGFLEIPFEAYIIAVLLGAA